MTDPNGEREEKPPGWWIDSSAVVEPKEEFECRATPLAPEATSVLPSAEPEPCSKPQDTSEEGAAVSTKTDLDRQNPTTLPRASSLADVLQIGRSFTARPLDLIGLAVIVRTPQRVRRGRVIPIRDPQMIIGRGAGVGCLLEDRDVADYHAVINHEKRERAHGFFIYPVDAHVVNLNGKPIQADVQLACGDRIRVGETEMVFFEAALDKEGGNLK